MEAGRGTGQRRWLIALGAVAVVVAIVLAAVALTDDDEDVDATGEPTSETTTTTASTTTTEATTTTADLPLTADPSQTVFPDPGTSRRFDSPEALVASFAREYVRMTDPVVGDFQQGDSRSGEIEVRGFDGGAPTTVLVRQLEDDTWFVIGAVTESIQPATPEPGEDVTSPIGLTGQAYAFEGTISVKLIVDGDPEPAATTFVTGSGDGILGDYEGELPYDVPAASEPWATILYTSDSAEDGAPLFFTVTRIHLG